MGMEQMAGAPFIVIMCVIILCVLALRRKAEFVLNFMLRSITGVICIFMINELLASQHYATMVGINPWTALTSGILGLPGVALLYGIHFLKFL